MCDETVDECLFLDISDAVAGLVLGDKVEADKSSIVNDFVNRFQTGANVAKAEWTDWNSGVQLP